MKLHLLSAVSALSVLALTSAAHADVFAYADLYKDKDVYIVEETTKTKDYTITVKYREDLKGSSESAAIANITNIDNKVEQTGENNGAGQIDKTVDVYNSVRFNKGITGVNLDVGNMVNQGNINAFAVTGPTSGTPTDKDTIARAEAWVEQDNYNNESRHKEAVPNRLNLDVQVRDSINNNEGITNVNLNAGNMNNQTNANSLSVGLGSALALSDAALGQETSNNKMFDENTLKEVRLTDSVNQNNGITNVNAATGHMNNQANAVSVAAVTSTALVGAPINP